MRSLLLLVAAALSLPAHIGVNDVFFEGLAGPYQLFITIRPPVVIPGVAEISIRSAARDVKGIRIAPMTLTGAGSKFPPTPDQTVQSKEDPQTFTGGLWIMSAGSWQVRAIVDGERGPGVVSVPVRAASQKVSTMDRASGGLLAFLMLLLAAGVVGIAGASFREAHLPPGVIPDRNRNRAGAIAMAVGIAIVAAIIWFGDSWWNSEAVAYARTIYKPLKMQAAVHNGELQLSLSGSGWMQPKSVDDFVPDHGYLMHLYAAREPKLDAVFHLHPKRQEVGKFLTSLPAMPAGNYRLFADIVHESGFPETLTGAMTLASATSGPASSKDDAGSILPPDGVIQSGGRVVFEKPAAVKAGQSILLKFKVLDRDGNSAANLRRYLDMPAHLAIFKKDFSVFSHLHPNGNVSMAALEMARLSNSALSGGVLASSHDSGGKLAPVPAEFSFPFGFPASGEYRIVLQFRRLDAVETTTFEIAVQN